MALTKLLTLMLIVLLSIQAVATVASAADFHQIDVSHLQQSHDHANDNTAQFDDHPSQDCHHCGHCSGSHLNLILLTQGPALPYLPLAPSYPADEQQLLDFIEQQYRPPIA